jgi:hypothetical protein
MRWWTVPSFALAALACTLAAPSAARAEGPGAAELAATSPARARPRVRALELQGLAMTQLLPRIGLGGDLAFVFGHPSFQARVGAMVVGVPAFRLGEGSIANLLQAGTLDACAAKRVLHHQVRMCMGGQAGAMAHVWKGYERPGRTLTPWVAGTLKGDYQVFFTQRFGMIGSVGMVIPMVGPTFRAVDRYGSYSPLVFPGPIAGYLSLGTSLRW